MIVFGDSEEASDCEDEEVMKAMDAYIEPNCKCWNGWRTSYRAEDPTEPRVQQVRKQLRRKREWLQPIIDRLKAEAPRHTPHAIRWQRATRAITLKSERSKRITMKMAAKRDVKP